MGRVILVHGAGAAAFEWVRWQRLFSAHAIETIAPDLVPKPVLAATGFADYVAQIDALRGAADVLIGASLGALLALAAANRKAPAALVLVNPASAASLAQTLQRDESGILPWGRDANLVSTRRSQHDCAAETALWTFRRWRDESSRVLREAASMPLLAPPCPCLFVIGLQDRSVAAAEQTRTAAQLGAEVLALTECGHLGPLLGEQAVEHAARVLAWLKFRATAP